MAFLTLPGSRGRREGGREGRWRRRRAGRRRAARAAWVAAALAAWTAGGGALDAAPGAAAASGAASGAAAGAAPGAASGGASLEYDVKAAFLYNFAKFVEWPAESFAAEGDPLALCIFGEDPFGARLDELVTGEKTAGRTLAVRRIRRLSELKSCHIVFSSRAERGRVPEVLASLHGGDVLSVGESERFAEQGGIIQLYLEGNKVHFMVNLDALERTRLKMSSKLLRVARVMRPEARGGGSR